MLSKQNLSMNNKAIGKERFRDENIHPSNYFHLGKIVFSPLLTHPIYQHSSLLWSSLSMGVSGKIIQPIEHEELFLSLCRALEQDKSRDSTSSYKLLSDSSSNEQGNWIFLVNIFIGFFSYLTSSFSFTCD